MHIQIVLIHFGKRYIWIFGSRIHWLRLWIHDAFPRTFTGALSKWSFTEHRKALWRDLVEQSATRTKHVGWNSETVGQRNLWITMAGRFAWIYVCTSCLWQVRALCYALIFSNGASFPSLERLGVLVLTLSWKHWKENLQETMFFPSNLGVSCNFPLNQSIDGRLDAFLTKKRYHFDLLRHSIHCSPAATQGQSLGSNPRYEWNSTQ